MTKRSPVLILALTLVTFGLYPYYWLFKTSEELRNESGRRDISPFLDAFLAFMTVGAWGVWAGYRNAKVAHELFERRGEEHTDHSLPIAVACAASYLVGPWTWLVAMILLQQDLDRLAEPHDYFADLERPRRVRVDVDPPVAREPARAEVPRSDVSVWESNAPAPIVY